MTLTIFALIVLLFSYFRLTIIGSGNVAYTYDQGRDFLAGARMVVDRDLVFIGPTTGIGGMFHGPWWYYMTAFSFLVLGSNPLNYYYCLFGIHLITLIVWMWLVRRYFGDLLTVLSSSIIASAPYYVGSHTFAGNNILAIPSFTFFCLTLVSITFAREKHASKKSLLLLAFQFGLWAGFVAETELSFGIFMAPAIITLIIMSKELRTFFAKKYHILALVMGLGIPFLPRLLFEVKNQFLQTKVLLGFFTKPKLYNPRSYFDVFYERTHLFNAYMEQSVGTRMLFVAFAVSIMLIFIYVLYSRAKKKTSASVESTNTMLVIKQLSILLGGLFVFSLIYRDPFWGNYYEGIQAGFLLLFVAVLAFMRANLYHLFKGLILVLCVYVLLMGKERLQATMYFKATVSGVALQSSVVDHIVTIQKKRNERVFCARVFTPPVIPHTYDYLWFYYYREGAVETPRYNYLNGRCWYIIEPEWKGFEFRQTKWKEQNIPLDAMFIKGSEKVIEGITVAEYEQSVTKNNH